jgi:N-acetylmuramoyl-L-alanine amidase
MRKIDEILVHCAATPEGKDFTVEDIDKWHKARGFKKIGYHFVIYNDGSIHKGRDIEEVGAHCTGHNSRSIGICYIGGVAKDGKTPKDTRTEPQKIALLELLKELKVKYPEAKLYGHRDFANKACPSFDAKTEYKNI